MNIRPDEPLAVAAVEAIRSGDLAALERLLSENPNLSTARISGGALLHVAADWSGHFPGSAATIAALIGHGADVNARFTGAHTETPLRWAASSDDVGALDALLDDGADIEAPGALIGGGTPLADAVAFGAVAGGAPACRTWARTTLWEAAALGLMARWRRISRVRRRPRMRSLTHSGAHATAGSAGRRSVFSAAPRTSTGLDTKG